MRRLCFVLCANKVTVDSFSCPSNIAKKFVSDNATLVRPKIRDKRKWTVETIGEIVIRTAA